MRLFAPSLAFVDLETTGTLAAADAITEVGIVRVDADPDASAEPRVSEWSTLVNPGLPIPPEIQALTGITDSMVRDAPRFDRIADEVAARTAGAVFVAHNARFDYGFLKHAFARIERRFSVTTESRRIAFGPCRSLKASSSQLALGADMRLASAA